VARWRSTLKSGTHSDVGGRVAVDEDELAVDARAVQGEKAAVWAVVGIGTR